MSRARATVVVAAGVIALCLVARVDAQRGARRAAAAAARPRAAAPIDLTGYWVSIVTQDWRWRMVTPRERRLPGHSADARGRKVADAWDPAKDEAAGEQCRSYGAPALMSVPGRLHITWQDDNTLKVETDAGTQTRLLRFGDGKAPADAPRTWQGVSVAQWQTPRPNVPLHLRPAERTADAPAVRPDRRIAARRDDEPARRIPAEERRPLQRERRADRALGSLQAAERRGVADDHDAGRRSAVSAQREAGRAGLQEGTERRKWDPTPCSAQVVGT